MVLPRMPRLRQSSYYWMIGMIVIVAMLLNSMSYFENENIQVGEILKPQTLRLAFVGNSIQYVNDCPKYLENMLQHHYSSITQEACLQGGATLVSLMEGSSCMPTFVSDATFKTTQSTERVLKQKWDYVIMNDQTQAPVRRNSRENTIRILKERYLPLINPSTTVIFIMTAAYRKTITGPINNSQDLGTFDEFTESLKQGYIEYASIFPNAKIVPLGLAYQYIKRNYDTKVFNSLYETDEYHPSPHGTYLEACILYCIIEEREPPSYDKSWWEDERYELSKLPLPSKEEAEVLRQVAWKVCNMPTTKTLY